MDESRDIDVLASGAEELGICLGLAQLDQFRRYYEELVEWNARVNLTAITDWDDVQLKHYLDSLSVSLVIPPALLESGRYVDVGSGAGFPGVPLKIAFPGLDVTLIESTSRKTAFLVYLKDVLGLPGVEVRTGRAETLAHDPELRERYDVVSGRGVAALAALAELTLPFCRAGGIVVAQKKLDIEDELAGALLAIEAMGGRLKEVRQVSVGGLRDRALVVMEKVEATPEHYPRRPGIPAKRPL